jgi:hypothetical protein
VKDAIAIPSSWIDFVESGVSTTLGTSNAAGLPEVVRAAGAVVLDQGRRLDVFVPIATGVRTRSNLEGGSAVAVTFNRPIDFRTMQVKGGLVGIREMREHEVGIVRAYGAAFAEALYVVGMARAVTRRLALLPAFALEINVEACFEQTPGPSAGTRLRTGAAQ